MNHGVYMFLETSSLAFVMVAALQDKLGQTKKFRVGRADGVWYVGI
ncbi:hypothetical protein CNR37_00098 [Pseudomonas phage ventosus]|uniref:Uncharacterized protein n=1 Tax=Pseudomonas phage ventosus TaxID=2048980 RepID=A0A2H4P805_9CAUD|nr:hypothetical protein CNR37_00098 [Pseudomonas phage ventosus]